MRRTSANRRGGDVEATPELVVEIASSSLSFDLHTKLHVCRRNGVLEDLVWRSQDGPIDWFVLRGGADERLADDERGVVPSDRFPGLWLSTTALLQDDLAATLQTLSEGTATAEHTALVAQLSAAAPPSPSRLRDGRTQ